MNIKEYSLKKDGEKYVTNNIKVKELRCKDGTDEIRQDYVTVCIAQFWRTLTNGPVIINSAFRTKNHNKKIGGVSNSSHLKSCALDIKKPAGFSTEILGNFLYSIGVERIKVVSSYVHFDIDDEKLKWLVGKFTKINIPYQNFLLKNGVKSYLVAIIQWKLNVLGYEAGIEDGIFGKNTEKAVRFYQEDMNLKSDGIIGINTWNKLFKNI